MARLRHYFLAMLVLAPLLVSPGCVRPAKDRAQLDRTVGKAHTPSVHLKVVDGLAAVHSLKDGELDLWAQAPVLDLDLDLDADAPTRWTIALQNAMPADQISATGDGAASFGVASRDHSAPTVITWTVDLQPGASTTLHIAPPDADTAEGYRFAVLSDIQDAVSSVGDIYKRMNQDPKIRFVVSTGDITQFGTMHELRYFMKRLGDLDVPFFTTTGNHEIGPADPAGFHNLYGRANFHFRFKGVAFTFIDSGSSTVDPLAYDWLRQWLDEAKGDTHVFVTHIPPIDPSGIRNGAFASRNEAAKLLEMLAKGKVNLALYGHIHSYYAQSNAHIPIFISGGGGALPEKFDGIGRNYLTVDIAPDNKVAQVGVVRIEPFH